jgi:hypothetical protein
MSLILYRKKKVTLFHKNIHQNLSVSIKNKITLSLQALMAIGSKVKRVQASNPTDNINTRKWIYRIKYDKIAQVILR